MTIEGLVKPPVPHIVGPPWKYDGHWGYHAGGTVTINEITAPVVQGHRYRVTVSSSGLVPCTGSKMRTYMIGTDADTICSQRIGFVTGGFAGLIALPMALCGLWTAPADNPARVFSFILVRDDPTSDSDWELSEATHQMFVEDMGAP